jgi:thioredoxin-related protein
MRRTIVAVAVASALVIVAATSGAAEGIKWHESLDEALKASAKSGKLVMLTLHTEWCGWCHKLQEETWPADAVIAKSADFECVAVDPEKTQVSEEYNNGSYPRTLFLRSDGAIVSEIGGFLPPEEFVAQMGLAAENLKKLAEAEAIEKRVAKPEDDLPSALRAGTLYAEIGQPKKALEWLRPVYEHAAELADDQRAEATVAYGTALATDRQYEKAVPVLQEVAEKYPTHPRAREVRFALGLVLAQTGKVAEARAVWQKLVDEKPDDDVGQASAHNVQIADQVLKGQ